MSNKTLGEIEQTIFNDLVRLIKNQLNDFLDEVFDKTKGLDHLQSSIQEYLKEEKSMKLIKEELKDSAKKYKQDNQDIAQNKSFSEIFKLGGYQDYYIQQKNSLWKDINILKEKIKEYDAHRQNMQDKLTEIVPYIVKFQTVLSTKLQISITFLLTTEDTASYKTYNKDTDTIQNILQVSSDDIRIIDDNLTQIERVSSLNEEQSIMPLVTLITQEVDKLEKENKQVIINAITNEESTYKEVVDRYIRGSNRHNIYWQIYGYNQAEKIPNLGPVEEARQGFLLRIHQKDVYDLFQQEKSRVEGNIYQKGQKATTRNIDESVEMMVHNFVRSRYGISSTDKRSGLIIDDHVFAAEEILKGVRDALHVDENANFISIASKTTSAGYTGFKQFFTLINNLISYRDNNINDKVLFDYIAHTFFADGLPLTQVITDGSGVVFKNAEEVAEQLISQSVENKK